MSITYPEYPLTAFPNSRDSILAAVDIIFSDVPKIAAYEMAILNGVSAEVAIQQSGIDPKKVFNAGRLNQMSQAIMAIQKFLNDPNNGFVQYITQQTAVWNNSVSQFTYRGVYATNVVYYKNNYVLHTTADKSIKLYIALQDMGQNIPPTNTTYWRPFVVSVDGSLIYQGDWLASRAYIITDIVTQNGSLYQCILPNTGQPVTNKTYWLELIGRGISKQYPFQKVPPPNAVPNQIWIQEY